jgi:hypothetical protein
VTNEAIETLHEALCQAMVAGDLQLKVGKS